MSAFIDIDKSYFKHATENKSGHVIVGGENYGQGSSREHAALGPRYLGLRLVIAKSFARIHWQNLINFGILPLTFSDPNDYDLISVNDTILIEDILNHHKKGNELNATLENKKILLSLHHDLSSRQIDILAQGGLINWTKKNNVS